MLVYREFSFQKILIKLLLWNFRSEDDVLTHIIFFSNIYRPPLYKKCFIELNHITILSFISADWIALTKAMAPHSITLAWKIPWTEEPGRLQSMGSQRVGHHWATSLSLFTFMHWRRKWQPTPVFFPGESQGWGSLVGCRLWGRTELDTTEAT